MADDEDRFKRLMVQGSINDRNGGAFEIFEPLNF
jgi:hypothetical protein